MCYGANTATSAGLVSADGRFASSRDGYTFVDGGLALDHSDPAIWGYGDELFPLVGFNAGDNWFCYYVPNGTAQRGSLGVAWGNAETRLSNSSQCRSEGIAVPVWGPGGWARLSPSSYAIFVSSGVDTHADGNHTDVYRVDPASPASFTGPVESYQFPNATKSTVLLDLESMTWFIYYRMANPSAYGVRTAPVILE